MMHNVPGIVNKVLNGRTRTGAASSSSSGYSTPNKRISFAELPESYASTRPGSSRFKEKHNRKKRKGSGDDGLGFMSARWWLGGGGGEVGENATRYEERVEDRITRNWGARVGLFASGLDDWAA